MILPMAVTLVVLEKGRSAFTQIADGGAPKLVVQGEIEASLDANEIAIFRAAIDSLVRQAGGACIWGTPRYNGRRQRR